MAVRLERPPMPRSEGASRAYILATATMARAAARGDEVAVGRLIVRRERLLASFGPGGPLPSRAALAEVRALEAQTMVALGAAPVPARSPARPTAHPAHPYPRRAWTSVAGLD